MPTISFFYGISIRTLFNDRAPPHFHAVHGRDEAKFAIADGSLIGAGVGPKQRRLVKQWTIMYHDALMRCWDAARADRQPDRIPGLGADNDDDLIHIRKLKRLGGYRLDLWFTDGRHGEWDFSELATRQTGPMVEPFRDPNYFNRVFLEQGGLTWPNGYDWAPEALHADMAAAGVLKVESAAA